MFPSHPHPEDLLDPGAGVERLTHVCRSAVHGVEHKRARRTRQIADKLRAVSLVVLPQIENEAADYETRLFERLSARCM